MGDHAKLKEKVEGAVVHPAGAAMAMASSFRAGGDEAEARPALPQPMNYPTITVTEYISSPENSCSLRLSRVSYTIHYPNIYIKLFVRWTTMYMT